MTLPSATDLDGMDYAFQGQPYVEVPAKSDVVLTGMDYVFCAQPFVSNPFPSGGGTGPTLSAVQDGTHIDLTWSD